MQTGRSDTVADLLVIGGGITGVGIAQDAAARGLKTVLVEKGDFASGTSSKSSKLIHGGLRYLEHLSFRLMRESISERHTLARLAPGLVHWTPFLIPYYKRKREKWKYSMGLWLYDHMASTPADRKHRMLAREQITELAGGLREEDLQGGASYYDCVTDDARLVLALALDAQARGAQVHNYVAAEELIREKSRAAGVVVRDALTGNSWEIRAAQIVCATGPWTDLTLGKLGEQPEDRRVRPAKGVHILLPRGQLAVSQATLIPSARDQRFLFIIPWHQGIVVGTTDAEYLGDPDAVEPGREDMEYILDALNWSFPRANLTANNLVSSYAGIRPLINVPGKSTADVPREYKIFESKSGIISVVGGKLTTYRIMARQVVDRVARKLSSGSANRVVMPCWTHRIKLGSPPDGPFNPFGRMDLPEDVRNHLIADYGVWSQQIVAILEKFPRWRQRMVPELPHILAEAYFAVTHEMARTLEDVLVRRTRVALLDPDHGRGSLRDIVTIMAEELKWDAHEVERQIETYEMTLRRSFPGAKEKREPS